MPIRLFWFVIYMMLNQAPGVQNPAPGSPMMIFMMEQVMTHNGPMMIAKSVATLGRRPQLQFQSVPQQLVAFQPMQGTAQSGPVPETHAVEFQGHTQTDFASSAPKGNGTGGGQKHGGKKGRKGHSKRRGKSKNGANPPRSR